MSTFDNQCCFSARLRNVRHLAAVIKSIHFKDIATCRISPDGLTFILEESRCLFGRCLIQKQIFEDFKFVPPMAEATPFGSQSHQGTEYASHQGTQSGSNQQYSQRMPSGYGTDGTINFGINLATLLSCLNMFGTAVWSTTQGGENNNNAIGSGFGSGPITAIKLSYNGIGSKFNLTLEDDGVVTTCGVPTFDPEPPVDFEFNEENHSKIIMKAQWLEEGLRDLDATSDRVVIRLSPEIPHLRISSLGTIENLDVNYSQGDVIETFVYQYDRPIEISYNFLHVQKVLLVCPMATKANLAIDSKDFMRIQFLLPVVEHKYLFAEYSFSPLEALD
ncbi:Rad1/Rec1/Rad17 [Dissophora ornata]|nr:Rad1/Rec1/Rad17 [Dissophora ornata]